MLKCKFCDGEVEIKNPNTFIQHERCKKCGRNQDIENKIKIDI